MTGAAPGPIRYLDEAAVRGTMPPALELVALAEVALRSLVAGAEVPEKAALGGGPGGVFAHAMPARLVASAVPGGGARGDLLGLKWISGGPANRAAGLPALAALIVLNDPFTGRPEAILEGGVITAARTAALSGVAIRLLAPPRAGRALIVGAGAQGRAHVEMLGALLPGVSIMVHDRHPERAAALAGAAAAMPGVVAAVPVADPLPAAGEADVIVSATSLTGSRPVLGPADIAPEALVLPVDYGAWVTPELVGSAALVVDDAERFGANRGSGRLAGWPDPWATLGDLLLAPRERPRGRVVALHQGPSIADVIVADAVLRSARERGLGVDLPR